MLSVPPPMLLFLILFCLISLIIHDFLKFQPFPFCCFFRSPSKISQLCLSPPNKLPFLLLLTQPTCHLMFPSFHYQTFRKKMTGLSFHTISLQFSVAWLWFQWLPYSCSLKDLLISNPAISCQVPTLTDLFAAAKIMAFFHLSSETGQVHYPSL